MATGFFGKREFHFQHAKHLAVACLGVITAGALHAAEPAVIGKSNPSQPRALFRMEPVSGDPQELANRFSQEQLALLEKLNRADVAYLPRLKEIVVPDRWDLDELAYSPLPNEWPKAQGFRKVIIVSQPEQVFGAYEDGSLSRWGPVSSGRQDQPTPKGLFYLNWKSVGRRSTINRGWFLPWYFNFHNARGISFHQFELPGRPASHGCIRLLGRDAQWIYEWGDQWQLDGKGWNVEREGTPVLIVGSCDYGKEVSWRSTEYLTTRPRLPFDAESLLEIALARATSMPSGELPRSPEENGKLAPLAAGGSF